MKRIYPKVRSRNGRLGRCAALFFVALWSAHLVAPTQTRGENPERKESITSSKKIAEVRSAATLTGKANLKIEVEGTIPYSFERVRAVLLDIAGFEKWFPSIGIWRILATTPSSVLVHGSQDFPWPMRDRDYVVLYAWEDHVDGHFTLEAMAQSDALPGPGHATVRVEHMRSLWTLEDAGEGSAIRYVWEGEAGMPLPERLARYGWQSYTNAVVERLGEEVGRRQAFPSP